ncbi:FkbM family methyltransferase [Stenotrophomonas sp. NLF4-10]|uniref:FkbM family methyltransferase n=1 Tax=Stenotrophomonas sp. NLF4-10 TaxID=2918754 RepID=UPI001EFC0DD4|nr:FkbM family methyltransferase [Stenotrophomonas sp. NLF4-10]MCG8277393.1 FkbM family methyltransferase [Stenotrophomonas sp. NLF4-10]
MKVVKKMLGILRIARGISNHPIHRGRKTKAIIRWLFLVISSRLTPTRQIAIPYVGESILVWPEESTSVTICARYGLGEYADMAFLLHMLRSDDIFCDVGANAGVYTVLAGHSVGCNVVAIEPIPRTFDLLMQNVFANHIAPKVDAKNIGVGSKRDVLNFTSSLWSYNHVVETCGDETIRVDVFPLDHVLNGNIPCAIKIDVEGFEAQVIQGAMKTLSNPLLQAVIVEVWHGHLERYSNSTSDVLLALQEAGLHGPYWYEPEGRILINPGQQEKRKFNQIFVRDIDWVLARVKESRQYEIHGALV